jgi:hypothetical protein
MKPRDFATMLRAYVSLLGVRNQPFAESIGHLAAAFDNVRGATVAAGLKAAEQASVEDGSGMPLGSVVPALEGLAAFGDRYFKSVVAKDVLAVLRFAEAHPGRAMSALVVAASHPKASTPRTRKSTPVRADIVSGYVSELLAALGDNQRFTALYQRLRDDALSPAELKAIAKQFTIGAPRSKNDALKKIWNRHQAMTGAQARVGSVGGRSAA